MAEIEGFGRSNQSVSSHDFFAELRLAEKWNPEHARKLRMRAMAGEVLMRTNGPASNSRIDKAKRLVRVVLASRKNEEVA